MNKLSVGLLLAASLFLMDVSPAAAHPGADGVRVHAYGHHAEVRKHRGMPRWLKRNHSFRHWYRHSPLKRHRSLSWHQLYEIYRWERDYFLARRYQERYDDGRYQDRYDDDRHHERRRRNRS